MTTPTPTLPLPPHALPSTRWLCAAISAVLGLASLGVIAINLFAGRQTEFLALSLEACGLLAGVFGLLFFRSRFAAGPAMTLACIAGTFFTVAFLSGRVALRFELQLASGDALNLRTFTFARIGLALVLALLAAFEVLRRSQGSKRYLVQALAAGSLLAALGGGMFAGRDRIAAGTLLGPSWATWTAAGMATVALMALACIALHCTIRAFELGRPGEPTA
jgi:hypothetical protein